jgi:hypothetical protein
MSTVHLCYGQFICVNYLASGFLFTIVRVGESGYQLVLVTIGITRIEHHYLLTQ